MSMISFAVPQAVFAQANEPFKVILASCAGNSCAPAVEDYLKGLPRGRASDAQVQELSVALAELGQGARNARQCKSISAALVSLSNSAGSTDLKSQILGIAQALCARTFVTAAILAVEREDANNEDSGRFNDGNNLIVAENPVTPPQDETVPDDSTDDPADDDTKSNNGKGHGVQDDGVNEDLPSADEKAAQQAAAAEKENKGKP